MINKNLKNIYTTIFKIILDLKHRVKYILKKCYLHKMSLKISNLGKNVDKKIVSSLKLIQLNIILIFL